MYCSSYNFADRMKRQYMQPLSMSYLEDDRLELPCLFYNKEDRCINHVVFAVLFENEVLDAVPLFDKVGTERPLSPNFDEKLSNLLSVTVSSPITQGVRISRHGALQPYMQQHYTAMFVDY